MQKIKTKNKKKTCESNMKPVLGKFLMLGTMKQSQSAKTSYQQVEEEEADHVKP